jgi:hypothetical protein
MVWKFIVPIALGAALMGSSGALAADYRPDEFFKLDLPKAVLSPKPLGPVSHFQPVPVEAKADQKQPDQSLAAIRPEARPDVPRHMAASARQSAGRTSDGYPDPDANPDLAMQARQRRYLQLAVRKSPRSARCCTGQATWNQPHSFSLVHPAA